MPPGQQPRDEKISKTVKAIKKCGWRTTNEFVEGFYGSSEAAQSLRGVLNGLGMCSVGLEVVYL